MNQELLLDFNTVIHRTSLFPPVMNCMPGNGMDVCGQWWFIRFIALKTKIYFQQIEQQLSHCTGRIFNLLDGTLCNDLKSLHQHLVLIRRDFFCLVRWPWPLECTAVKPLVQSRKPSPSHRSPLMRSVRFPQKRNNVSLSYGSKLNWNRIMAASPSMPRRRSV